MSKTIKSPVIFIGCGRSGTSIIAEIIMRHPDLAYPSNYHQRFFKYEGISLLRHFFDNPFWKFYGQKEQLNKVSFFNKYVFRPDEPYNMWGYITGPDVDFSRGFLIDDKPDNARLNFIQNYFSKLLRNQRRKRLAFKLTGPGRVGYLSSIFPDAQFIVLKRNLIPVVSSFLKVGFWKSRGMDKFWWRGVYSEEEEMWASENKHKPHLITAYQLLKIEEVTKQECKKHDTNHLGITYESFVENPEAVLKSILEFLNLMNDSEDCFNYLSSLKIQNRNKKDEDYFNQKQLNEINELIRNGRKNLNSLKFDN